MKEGLPKSGFESNEASESLEKRSFKTDPMFEPYWDQLDESDGYFVTEKDPHPSSLPSLGVEGKRYHFYGMLAPYDKKGIENMGLNMNALNDRQRDLIDSNNNHFYIHLGLMRHGFGVLVAGRRELTERVENPEALGKAMWLAFYQDEHLSEYVPDGWGSLHTLIEQVTAQIPGQIDVSGNPFGERPAVEARTLSQVEEIIGSTLDREYFGGFKKFLSAQEKN